LDFAVTADTTGWIGIGFSIPDLFQMLGSDAFIGFVTVPTPENPNISLAANIAPFYLGTKALDTSGILSHEIMQVYNPSASEVDGRTILAFTHDLSEQYNGVDLARVGGPVVTIVGSVSGEDGVNSKHGCRTKSGYYLNLLTGQNGPVYRYATPIRIAHGVMMGTAFALLFPIGLLFARYGKAEGGFWFKVHFFCQIYASIIGLVGIIIGYSMPEVQFQTRFHAQLGTVIFVITFIQVVMGLLRPDHTPKGETPKPQRRVF